MYGFGWLEWELKRNVRPERLCFQTIPEQDVLLFVIFVALTSLKAGFRLFISLFGFLLIYAFNTFYEN